MAPLEPESSEPGRPLVLTLASLTSITDLTDKIVRPGGQYYSAAGGFGDVFRCQYTSEDGIKEVAVKAFRFSFSVNEDEQDEGKAARMIRRELGIWKRLDHPNIVPFLGIAYGFGWQRSASLVSMWMPHGTLHAFLRAHHHQLEVAHRLQLLLDIANGLHYLHSFPMVHGDLTSNNVLLDHNYNARLTDFGCASLVGELPEGFTELVMSTLKPGTLRWTAPEHISLDEEEAKHTIKCDIYSFGHIALFVLSGKYPWSEIRNDAAVVLMLARGLKPGRPLTPAIDDGHWDLIERCWLPAPERPITQHLISSLRQLLGVANVPGTIGLAESLTTRPSTPSPHLTPRGGPIEGPAIPTMDEHDIGAPLVKETRRIMVLADSPSSGDSDSEEEDYRPQTPSPPIQRTPRFVMRRQRPILTHQPSPQKTGTHANSTIDLVANTASWSGTLSGIFPGFGSQRATELQIHVFGFFTGPILTEIRSQIRTDLWPENLTLNLCKEPVKSNMELSFWLKRHQPWMYLMRFISDSALDEVNEQRFQALNKFMTEHRIFAYAGWQMPSGKFSYNIFIFPMGADFAGAVFLDGLPDLPGSGNELDVHPPDYAKKFQQPLGELNLSSEFIAPQTQQARAASTETTGADTPEYL